MTHVIEDDSYRNTVAALMQDEIIIKMAADMRGIDMTPYLHNDGSANHTLMMAALNEYKHRAELLNVKPIGSHIGGPAQAILNLLAETEDQ
jgi:hypothetical protein